MSEYEKGKQEGYQLACFILEDLEEGGLIEKGISITVEKLCLKFMMKKEEVADE